LSTARRVEAKDRSRLSVTWRCCFCRDPQNPCDPTYVRFPPRPCGKSGPSSLSLRSLPQSDRNPFSKTVECQYLQFSTGLARRLEVSRASALSTGQASSGFSLTQTPNGRIITCSADAADCGVVFAAHFALSHARSLVTHLLAGGCKQARACQGAGPCCSRRGGGCAGGFAHLAGSWSEGPGP
jgi:hypothetical protein